MLSAGPTPLVSREDWELTVTTEDGTRHYWESAAFTALPAEASTVDLHCVARWSKFGTEWEGVSPEVLLENVELGW
ncbi:molybdopterin-dependent oxidoreductase [Streptomyces sp. NPDC059909]|uniref:molybdopterin-dependent oxidoreductase n=1 Tax=Streptomyces sp. NPDC059909 TaxID=3346998 RepID=UPI0036636DD7